MGNIFRTYSLDDCIISTKKDIMMDYDLTNENQVRLANSILLESFSNHEEYIKTKLFVLNDPDYISFQKFRFYKD